MFDERRRDFDGYYAHLAYVKEEKEQAIAEGLQQGREEGLQQGLQQGREEGLQQGLQQGREEGIEQGRLGTVVNLIKKGIITKEEACEELGVSVQELEKHL